MAMAGAIGSIAGLVGDGVTGLIGGIQQYQMAQYNAESAENAAISQRNLMEFNAKMEEREAAFSQNEARQAEMRQRRQAESFMGSQRAALGAAGITGAGSPLEVFGQTAANLEIAALDIRRQGEVANWEHKARAVSYRYQGASLYNAGMAESKMQSYTGKVALIGGIWKAIDPMTFGSNKGNAFNMVDSFKNSGNKAAPVTGTSAPEPKNGGGFETGSGGDGWGMGNNGNSWGFKL